MSVHVQFLVDEHATLDEAEARAERLRQVLFEAGWLALTPNTTCVPEGVGFPPGTTLASFAPAHATDLYSQRVNGVRIEAKRFSNLTYPFDVETIACPVCHTSVDHDHLREVVDEWLAGDDDVRAVCRGCHHRAPLRAWQSTARDEPPVAYGNLVVTLFDWPRLDAPGWSTNLLDVVEGVLGARPTHAWTRL